MRNTSNKIIDATLRFVDKFTGPMNQALGSMEKSSKHMQRMGNDIEKAGKKITGAGRTLTAGITAPVAAAGLASLRAGIDFESSFAGVKKTVNATDKQLATLKSGIIDMSQKMPASATEIAGVAEAAGQLGIQTDNILSFTKVMTDLGNSTNLSAGDAASALAKYANVTGMSQKDFGKLGSSIVALGNNFATSESDIVSMATRLAGAGHQIGLSDGEIMGFSTALSSVGIEAEMGGSAFSKAMTNMQVACETGLGPVKALSKKTGMSLRDMQLMSANNSKDFKEMAQSLGYTSTEMNSMIKAGTNLENFASVAGMTSGQFKKAYEKDAAGALQSFVKGLGNTKGKGESTIKMLQDMGFTEVRLRDTLTRLSGSGGNMAKAVQMGNSAWKENSALTKEASQRYATTESKIEMAKNKMNALGIQVSDILMPTVLKAVDKIGAGITKFQHLDEGTKKTIVKVAGIAAALGPSLLGVGKLTSGVGGTIKGIGEFGETAKKSVSAFKGLQDAGKIGKAGTAFAKFGNVGKLAFMGLTNPATLVVGGIAAITLGAFLLIKNWNKVKSFFGKFGAFLKGVFTKSGGDSKKFSSTFVSVKNGIATAVTNLKAIFGQITKALKPVIKFVSGVFIGQFKVGFAMVGGVASALVEGIRGNVDGIIKTFSGITTFISGVFSGDWKKALEGLKTIFSGIVTSFVSIAKVPINAVIGLINGAINGINGLGIKIPHWVPKLGGKTFGINIPPIPMLAKGTKYWQGGTAITQDGGGEVMDLPRGTRVWPHDESVKKAYQAGASQKRGKSNATIIIKKIADKIEVRNDKDIDTITDKIAEKFKKIIDNGGGELEFA